jgi:subtilase family serine protease
MSITLSLAPRNAAALKQFVSAPHAALTPAQFEASYAPAQATVTQITSWARANGLASSVTPDRMLVTLTGSSTSIARALNTSFESFSSTAQGRFFGITRAATLPNAFVSQVEAVVGLSDLGKASLSSIPRPSRAGLTRSLGAAGTSAASLAYPSQYGPQDFWSMYNAPSAQTGSGQQLAIITEGAVSQPKTDLVTFEQKFGLPSVTWNQINVGTPTTDTSGDDEWDLDSQYSTGFAPGVSQLDVYVGPSLADADILSTIDRWVTDDLAKQGSFSAGECELLADASGFTGGLDAVLEEADAQGQTMFFASGDTGSQCPALTAVNGVPAGLPGVNYPASSPYGIGVGGTSVLSPSGPVETAWYAGGGGSSLIESTPAFQSSTKVGGVAPLAERGVPDVALDADPESGYEVIVSGTEETIGGTSASAPSWQGIWARAQGAHGGTLGFAGPVIYNAEPASAFHDITLGANGLYTALPGWDYTTGRGTPDITAFVNGA